MDRTRVSQSIILTVIMILGALSYSINDLSVLNNELTEKESVAYSASNNTYDPLILQTSYYDGSENPGYIGTTYDDRVIVYSEEQDSRGDFNIAISIYSYPEQGFEQPAGRSPLAIQIPEMNMDREILLPTNFSKMRPCTPILHPDDVVSLVCSYVSGQSTNEDLRLDFNSTNHTVTKRGGSMFVWNANDSLVSFLPLNGTLYGSNSLYSTKPKFNEWNSRPVFSTHNFTYIGLTRIVASGNMELNGTSYSCPTSMSNGCRAIYEFDRNGTVLNILFAESKATSLGECSVHVDDVSISNHIELKQTQSNGCKYRFANNTLLFQTDSSTNRPTGGDWIVLDSNLTLVKHFPVGYKCGSTLSSSYKSEIYDIETTSAGIAYFADTNRDCVNNNWLGTVQQTLHGSNVSTLSSVSGASGQKAIMSVGMLNFNSTSFESSTTIDWRYSWALLGTNLGSSNYVSPELKWFDEDKLYWAGSYSSGVATVAWSAELGGGSAPNLNPSNTGNGNEMASIFSLNGTWLQSIPKAQGTCITGADYIDFQLTTNGFSCSVKRDSRSGGQRFSVFNIDTDGDGFAKELDAFPDVSSQQYDTDLDGYGDNPFGYQADSCVAQPGNSTTDRYGCTDLDGDGTSDLTDPFVLDPTQSADTDNDGFGDNLSGFRGDYCPTVFGESARNSTYGCPDADFDGWANFQDLFPNESSQWSDSDADGFGDQLIGIQGDACPTQFGNSTIDRFGCVDSDGDGYSNTSDDFPNEPTQHLDSDGDGYGNNQTTGAMMPDAFPFDGTQWNDTDGDGHGDNPYGNQGDWFPNNPNRWQDSDRDGYADEDDAFINDGSQWNDTDGDGYGDEANGNSPDAFPSDPLEWQDTDGDGYGNNGDAFPVDGTQWNDTDGDGHGDNPYGTLGDWFPNDPTRWQDSDQDGYADEDDAFINDVSQWNDSDGDGYGDNANGSRPDEFPNDPLEWQDSDGDGYGNNGDAFPVDGTQWNDTDADGHGDNPYGTLGDWFPDDPNRWQDSDRDGFADEDDAFANDETQWNDTDGDGYGDNVNGSNADVFPNDSSEWKDTDEDGIGNNADEYPFDPTQHIDSDGDGYGDNSNGTRGDVFPEDPTEWMDIDGDGFGDNGDLFPSDGTQWNDSDGDGYGDNLNGANGDSCPEISGNSSLIILGCLDTDGDGYADIIDAFISNAQSWSDVDGDLVPDELDAYPNDATQSFDSDGDGFGDDPLGTNADKFPNDATQWNDIDGDGFGDNLEGNSPDLFKTDATQWADQDGDGYGDNPAGRLYDLFPDNPTQWEDVDGDGFGDNQSGTDADPYLDDFDNDGYNDSVDILPKLPSPGDLDADGCLDEVDEFVDNAQECVDTDGDGVGDNADSDDDGDGWTDADEQRLNTDPLSSGEQPVDSFEIVVPGTAVGLGAWDLIGIFGGVPFFIWIGFGFVTRNSRCEKYEDLLKLANSREELNGVAQRWEYSLMLRMLGPHQGIRLERLRAELDDEFEFAQKLGTEGKSEQHDGDVGKSLPSLTHQHKPPSAPPKETPATSIDEKGYEWLKDENSVDWYRVKDSGEEWQQFEG
ncbi:hypothetical protein N9Y01_01875 [Candidatus Poseidonia alphae]|nr:hypothetical protein [Candidatus Poseidonia alphae]